ncbi:hypothetical protein FHG87_023301 [Trinorchestia longiramus]|nr:hypothetical protein FHG87_023301 [Trinorchestia longiramus]
MKKKAHLCPRAGAPGLKASTTALFCELLNHKKKINCLKQTQKKKHCSNKNFTKPCYTVFISSDSLQVSPYLAYVRSALIYPAIPLHTLSPSSISKLQTVQNKATRSITNAEWHDFNTSAQLHRQTKLTPINTLLHEYAKKIWTYIEQMHPQLCLHLTFPQETRQIPHRAFPSSKTKILGPPPTPKYT